MSLKAPLCASKQKHVVDFSGFSLVTKNNKAKCLWFDQLQQFCSQLLGEECSFTWL